MIDLISAIVVGLLYSQSTFRTFKSWNSHHEIHGDFPCQSDSNVFCAAFHPSALTHFPEDR